MGWRPISLASAVLVLVAAAHADDDELATALASGNLDRAEELTAAMKEADRRCALGVIAIARADWARGFALVNGCAPARADLADEVRRARRRARRALESGAFAPVSIVVEPSPGLVNVSVFGDLRIETPAELWLPMGTHHIALVGGAGGRTVVVDDRSRRAVILHASAARTERRESQVDFSDEAATQDSGVVGDPEKLRYQSLLPERYRKRRALASEPVAVAPPLWAVALAARAGGSRWTGSSGAIASFGVGLEALRRLGPVLVRVEIGAQGKGGTVDGNGERVAGVDLALGVAGQVALAGDWRLRVGAGPTFFVPLRDRVAGRDLATGEANAVVDVAACRSIGAGHWLEVGARLGHGLNVLLEGLGRSQQALATIGVRFE